jgi:sigma-E factor negative regulatory protein RseB
MMNGIRKASFFSSLPGVGILLFSHPTIAADTPAEWLDRMAAAVLQSSYMGTVVRTRGGDAQALKIVHKVADGVVSEKVTLQEGNGLEIIRSGDEVHCILPDSKSVLVESWEDRSMIFSNLPERNVRFGHEYDLSLVRHERVAGRRAVLIAIRPHDVYRFGHRIWLDYETAFPLKTELVDGDGSLLHQVKFADINLETSIPEAALSPSIDIESFTFQAAEAKRVAVDIEIDWVCDDLPSGFQLVSAKSEQLPGTGAPVTHMRYSDGLATISVFIARAQKNKIAKRSTFGGSNAYSVEAGGYQITAVGEVPGVTAQRIATSMRQR